MNRFHQLPPLKNPSDLTAKNLTNLFSKYFDDQTLKLEILEEDEKFIEDNDNFQSLVTLFQQFIIYENRNRFLDSEVSSKDQIQTRWFKQRIQHHRQS